MRSRTGCLTCRQRKLKCDEARPVCGQCQKGNRHCEPSTGITFRHQHNASMNASPRSSAQSSLNGFYAYKDTFDRDVHWVDIPRELNFIHVTDPYNDERPDPAELLMPILAPLANWTPDSHFGLGGPELNTHGLEALSAAALSGVNALQASTASRPAYSPGERSSRKRQHTDSRTRGRVSREVDEESAESKIEQPIDPTLTAGSGSDGDSKKRVTSDGSQQALAVPDAEQRLDLILRSLNQSPGAEPVQRGHKEGEAVK